VDAKEAEHLMGGLDFADAATQDVRGAVNFLKKASSRVAVTGFCMGGALTILAAANVPEADAAVSWYGVPPLEFVDASKIRAPLMGHFALEDAFFPIAQVDALEKQLKQAGKPFEFFRYPAQHAFANETLINPPIPAKYDAPSAETAWRRTLDFFRRHLG
jgi:carboxymethylenebutenolidase